jgi:hypothetical protein
MTHHVTMPAKDDARQSYFRRHKCNGGAVIPKSARPGPPQWPPVLSASLVPCSAELPGEQPVIDPQRSVSAFSPKVE